MTDLENAIYAAAFAAYLNNPKPDTPLPLAAAEAGHTAVDLYRWSGVEDANGAEAPKGVPLEGACYSDAPASQLLSDNEHVLWREVYLLALGKGNNVVESARIANGSVYNLRRAPGRISHRYDGDTVDVSGS